jgi:hypothetical protein
MAPVPFTDTERAAARLGQRRAGSSAPSPYPDRDCPAGLCAPVLRAPGTPLVVVLDNAGIHKNSTVNAALPALWRERIHRSSARPYCPEVHRVERPFRVIRHQGMPAHMHRTYDPLEDAVQTAFLANPFTVRTCDGTERNPGLAA